jgi:hypothetical protein
MIFRRGRYLPSGSAAARIGYLSSSWDMIDLPNQTCERTGSSAGEFRCLFLIRALHLHPERGSQEPVAPLDR